MGAKQIRYLVGTILVLLVAGVLALDHVFDSRNAGSAILVGMGLVGYLEFSKMSSGRYLRLSSLPGLLATGLFLAAACWDWKAHEEGRPLLSKHILINFCLFFLILFHRFSSENRNLLHRF